MCDKEGFRDLRERVHALENSQGRFEEQLKTLFKSVSTLYRVFLVACLLLLLTVIYGAIGQHGFNAVTHSATNAAVIK